MGEVVDVYGVLDARAAPDGALEFGAPPVVQRRGDDGVQPPAAPNPTERAGDERAHGGAEYVYGLAERVFVWGLRAGHEMAFSSVQSVVGWDDWRSL